ncbi:MAG: hypothetical protein OEW67_12355 [Cyclobacteriaceae bacterium]|nr:hypothetical protein [Cyclobacteriaceae bacterium]
MNNKINMVKKHRLSVLSIIVLLIFSSSTVERSFYDPKRFADVKKWKSEVKIHFLGKYEESDPYVRNGVENESYYRAAFDHTINFTSVTNEGSQQMMNLFDKKGLEEDSDHNENAQEEFIKKFQTGGFTTTNPDEMNKAIKGMTQGVALSREKEFIAWMAASNGNSVHKTNDRLETRGAEIGEGYCCMVSESFEYTGSGNINSQVNGLSIGITVSENIYNFNLYWNESVSVDVIYESGTVPCEGESPKKTKTISTLKNLKSGNFKDAVASSTHAVCEENNNPQNRIEKYQVVNLRKSSLTDELDKFRKIPLPESGMELAGSRVLKGYFEYWPPRLAWSNDSENEGPIPIDITIEWKISPVE